jgi:hypothetical protein
MNRNVSNEQILTAQSNARAMKDYVSASQGGAIREGFFGEEGEYFEGKLQELSDIIRNMPSTGETDGKGDEAIVYLHYFHGGFDWYITEKDCVEGEPQYQAFGYADMGFPELGYISIYELIENGVQLDMHWTPRTLREVKAERGE